MLIHCKHTLNLFIFGSVSSSLNALRKAYGRAGGSGWVTEGILFLDGYKWKESVMTFESFQDRFFTFFFFFKLKCKRQQFKTENELLRIFLGRKKTIRLNSNSITEIRLSPCFLGPQVFSQLTK